MFAVWTGTSARGKGRITRTDRLTRLDGGHLGSVVLGWRGGRPGAGGPGRGASLQPVPGVMAVAPGGAAVAVWLVRVLVRVVVLFFHQGVVVPAVLRAGRQAVAALARTLIVVVLIGGHQAAPFDGRVVTRVVGMSHSLAL